MNCIDILFISGSPNFCTRFSPGSKDDSEAIAESLSMETLCNQQDLECDRTSTIRDSVQVPWLLKQNQYLTRQLICRIIRLSTLCFVRSKSRSIAQMPFGA